MRAQGPDPDAGHGGQDLGKRVRRHEFLDLLGDFGALLAQRRELRGQSWQHDAGGVRAGDHDRLRGERSEDLLGEPAAEPWRLLEQPGPYLDLPGCGESGWGGPGLEQVQHGRVIEPRSQDAFERGVDLGEQPTDPVAGRGDLLREVVVGTRTSR